MRYPRDVARRQFGLIGAGAIIAAAVAATAALADPAWYFSAYSGASQSMVLFGPYGTSEACRDVRAGYVGNDQYRNVSACSQTEAVTPDHQGPSN